MSEPYRIPAHLTTIETTVSRSRFIATVQNVDTVDSVKTALAACRSKMPDASHHVYAFRIGFGPSVVEGLSDDGEPSGTSGPPIMNVLRGSDLGDTLVIVTRYFGGTLLGTGGLVRAYSEAAALAIKATPTKIKIDYASLRVLVEYSAVTLLKRLLTDFDAVITRDSFTDSVELQLIVPAVNVRGLTTAILDITAGNAVIELAD